MLHSNAHNSSRPSQHLAYVDINKLCRLLNNTNNNTNNNNTNIINNNNNNNDDNDNAKVYSYWD